MIAAPTAAIVGSQVSKSWLPNGSSILSAEARELLMALDMVHQSSDRQLLFLSDSLSCLQSLKNRDLSHPLIADNLCRVHVLLSRGSQVVFMWVPSHVGLVGNSVAHIAAKASLLIPISNLPVPPSDFCSLIRLHSLKQWQENWNSETLKKLHAIEPKVNVLTCTAYPAEMKL
jgi:Reverse transcriptase-like